MNALYTITLYCGHCGAVVELTPTNTNARLNPVCRGQEEVATYTNGFRDPVRGNHPAERMRQLGLRPITNEEQSP